MDRAVDGEELAEAGERAAEYVREAMIPRFAIGTPGNPSPMMLRSVYAMEKPPGEVPFLDAGMGKPGLQKMDVATARNYLVERFLNAHEEFGYPEPLRWLLQVDGDAVVHKGTLQRLQSWNVSAVGALCVTRYRPYQPVVYRGICKDQGGDMRSYYVQWKEVREWCIRYPQLLNPHGPAMLAEPPEGSLHEVDWTGSHCFLVHRSVYEAIEPPWFENHSNVRFGSGSDRIFFEKVKAAGFQPRVDYSVVAGHEATMVLGMADFMAWQAISVLEDEAGESEVWVGDDTVKVRITEGMMESEDSEEEVAG